ncbi:hypothetical protein AMAG_05770 [Allomyces macrogynus ATCC 38327]|uniref:Pirin-like protein n=1 Tax=Allomyces macrogynus (strain ATCC 38327) TaxID=578462 RepID=A0A0L0SDA2_ALLM3|nr:hypothetical protein AMAG_05770 [Allomyces macrogynus ATCC 38327]|eukprot:KNE60380.1 hypothetical protein AMAG_05770 [Allomyces macrogynus ATCC 38327]
MATLEARPTGAAAATSNRTDLQQSARRVSGVHLYKKLALFAVVLAIVLFRQQADSNNKNSPPTTTTTTTMQAVTPLIRNVARTYMAREQAEGVGARVRRSIGTVGLRNLDPFLMLDEFRVSPPAGFSDHPHRGFETVTYMLSGAFEHEDFAGHRGKIGPGDLQWMTAGRGIVHAEVPIEEENSGLQLWVNLPASHKMMEPRYQELLGKDLPRVQPADGVDVTVIAGEAYGASAKVRTVTPICYFDIRVEAGSSTKVPVPGTFNAFAYVLEGEALFGGKATKGVRGEAIVFDAPTEDDAKKATEVPVVAGEKGVRFVVIGGEPINEPIVQHGPFVMNHPLEIRQAMEDYYSGSNGFERAVGFKSDISKRVSRH